LGRVGGIKDFSTPSVVDGQAIAIAVEVSVLDEQAIVYTIIVWCDDIGHN